MRWENLLTTSKVDDDLYTLYKFAMGQLMEKKCKKYKNFFSKEEFEENQHEIFQITSAKRKLLKKLEDGNTKR